jgi:hypothetical protein
MYDNDANLLLPSWTNPVLPECRPEAAAPPSQTEQPRPEANPQTPAIRRCVFRPHVLIAGAWQSTRKLAGIP